MVQLQLPPIHWLLAAVGIGMAAGALWTWLGERLRRGTRTDPASDGAAALPPGRPVVCPECSSEGPFAEIIPLEAARLHTDHEERWRVGTRWACQRCPAVFATDPKGVFRTHRHALPQSPEIRGPLASDLDKAQGFELESEPPFLRRPRERPPV